MGEHMSLQRYGVTVMWVGHSGLLSEQVVGITQALLNWQPPPTYFMLHAGGNEVGQISGSVLRNQLKQIIQILQFLMPNTVLIWSCILPRLQWRYSTNTKAMENVRIRINREIVNYIKQVGGKAIRYPDFQDKAPGLFSDDCHLSFIGNDIFLNTIQGAFETFIHNPDESIYPRDY